jgi:HEAT repeat protein
MNQTQKWIHWITTNDKSKRQTATLALGGLSDDADVDTPSLIAALEPENEDIVFWCLVALGPPGERSIKAVENIIKLTDSNNFGIRQGSIYALSRISKSSVELNIGFVKNYRTVANLSYVSPLVH